MARRSTTAPPGDGHIVDIDVSDEMRASFLEYAYSVIYARALPDARDGLKPVQRRILFQMAQSLVLVVAWKHNHLLLMHQILILSSFALCLQQTQSHVNL